VEDVGSAASTALWVGHASGCGATESCNSGSQFAVGAPFSSGSFGSTYSTVNNGSVDSTTASSGGFFTDIPSFSSGDQPDNPLEGAQGVVGTTGHSIFRFGRISVGSGGQQVFDRWSETSVDVSLPNLTEAKTIGLVETVHNVDDANNKAVCVESVAATNENGATTSAKNTYHSVEGQHARNEAESAVMEEAHSGDIEAVVVEPVNDGEAAPGNDIVEVSSYIFNPVLYRIRLGFCEQG
jgi:hypothetical protein